MMIVLPEELEVVAEMQVIDREVFYYLAGRTDNDNAVVGRRCRVSYAGIASRLSERMSSGRRSALWEVSSRDVRNSVMRLIGSGVLRGLSQKGKGNDLKLLRVFLADYIAKHSSVRNEVSRRLAGGLHDNGDVIASNNNSLRVSDADGKQAKTSEVSINTIHQYQHRADEPFSMTLDWKPSGDELKMILFRAGGVGFSFDKIDKAWVAEFVSFWWANPSKKLTQRQWTSKLGSKLVDYLRKPGLFEQQRGIRMQDEKEQQYVEKTSHKLPEWARPPRSDDVLGGWMRQHGYGDGPPGISIQETRGWLRREIDKRMADKGLPKIAH